MVEPMGQTKAIIGKTPRIAIAHLPVVMSGGSRTRIQGEFLLRKGVG